MDELRIDLEDIDPDSEYDYNQLFYAVLVKDWKKS